MNQSRQPGPRRAVHLAALCGALACAAAPALAAPDVGVTVHVSQPGVYGRVDIGNVPPPPPALVYAQPILVQPPPPPPRTVVVAPPPPVYMWVPPGHQKHWDKHCARYRACGVPVYFVQDRWYREHVQVARGAPPVVDSRPGYVTGPGYAPARVPGYEYGRDDDDHHRGGKHDDEREHGKGKGKDKDKDKDKGHGKGHGGRDD